MNLRSLSFPLALALAIAAAPGCDDKATPKTDGGRGGSGGSAGTGGRGGTGGASGSGGTTSGGSGGVTGGSGGVTGGSGGATGGSGGTTGGSGGTTPDASPDTTPTTDTPLPIDQMVTPDLPPDQPPLPPDTATTVMVSQCSQLNCPELTAVASACNSSESACTSQSPSANVTNYCHANGVKKTATTTYSGANGMNYHIVMPVKKGDGSACYTLEMDGVDDQDIENWVYKSPAGAELARGEWNNDTGVLTLICGGVRYVIGDIGCPGTDGQPEGECTAGACAP